jgi:hypothetical protein
MFPLVSNLPDDNDDLSCVLALASLFPYSDLLHSLDGVITIGEPFYQHITLPFIMWAPSGQDVFHHVSENHLHFRRSYVDPSVVTLCVSVPVHTIWEGERETGWEKAREEMSE